jgi:hypothetical protein
VVCPFLETSGTHWCFIHYSHLPVLQGGLLRCFDVADNSKDDCLFTSKIYDRTPILSIPINEVLGSAGLSVC